MSGRRGFTLIEVVIVMAIVAISLGLVGPRIGAGFGRLELNGAARTVRGYIRMARMQAERTDREQYVVLDRTRRSVALVSADLKLLREEKLPASVQIVLEGNEPNSALWIAPSGMIRGEPVRLRGRVGELEVSLQ